MPVVRGTVADPRTAFGFGERAGFAREQVAFNVGQRRGICGRLTLPGPAYSASVIVGHAVERLRLQRLVADAKDGRSRSLVLRGEAGMGGLADA